MTIALRRGACLVVAAAAIVASPAAEELDRSMTLRFPEGSYDRRLFRAYTNGVGGVWELLDNALRAKVTPGGADRLPMTFRCNFRLEGDFEIRCRYKIGDLPRPAAEFSRNALGIRVMSEATYAKVFRAHEPREPEEVRGYGVQELLARPNRMPMQFDRVEPAFGDEGSLALRRTGSTIVFLAADGFAPLVEIGRIAYPAGPAEIELQVTNERSSEGSDVTFEDVAISADKIVLEDKEPASGGFRVPWAPLAVGGAVVGAWWIRRRLREGE